MGPQNLARAVLSNVTNVERYSWEYFFVYRSGGLLPRMNDNCTTLILPLTDQCCSSVLGYDETSKEN